MGPYDLVVWVLGNMWILYGSWNLMSMCISLDFDFGDSMSDWHVCEYFRGFGI
jgi:hypothetical protein